MKELKDESWDVGGDVVAVVASAAWCGPCRRMAPELEALEGEMEGEVEFRHADMDACERSLHALNVRSVPTVILFMGGKEAGRWTGATDRGKLRARLRLAMADFSARVAKKA